MKIIKNAIKKVKPEWPKEVECYHCESTLKVDEKDTYRDKMEYSPREIDYNVLGFTCPCCKQFTSIL